MGAKRALGRGRRIKHLKGRTPEATVTPETPAVPEAPEIPETAAAPEAPETPTACQPSGTPEIPEAAEPSETAAAPEAPDTPQPLHPPEAPKAPDTPHTPRHLKAPKHLERKKHRLWPLFLGMAVYAVLFASAALCGLFWLWDVVAAYERAIPDYAVNDYMQSLSANHIGDAALLDLLERVDLRVQSVADCRREVLTYLEGETTCTKDTDSSTDAVQVFTLHHNGDVIGSFQLQQRGITSHGFTPWAVTAEHFDLSFLITDPVDVTVPEDYRVLINGAQLPDTCIVQTGIPYGELEPYPVDYPLPTMTRWEAGPFLGRAELTLRDAWDRPADGEPDVLSFLDNCSDEQRTALTAAVEDYLDAYVGFMTNRGGAPKGNLNALLPLVVPKSDLETRMRNTLAGMYWVIDRKASITGQTLNLLTRLDQGVFLCDVTYTISSVSGPQEDRIMLVFRETDGTYLVETMEQLV